MSEGEAPVWSEDLLSAYVDNELTPNERAMVETRVRQSPELQAVLEDVQASRAAVRALGLRDAPPGFWTRVLLDDAAAAGADTNVTELRPRRTHRATRWLVAASGVAAAAVLAAVILVPQPHKVTPPVAAFTDAHAVRSSLDSDAASSLAPIALQAGFRR
jgi:anti-sigma factor RsiW